MENEQPLSIDEQPPQVTPRSNTSKNIAGNEMSPKPKRSPTVSPRNNVNQTPLVQASDKAITEEVAENDDQPTNREAFDEPYSKEEAPEASDGRWHWDVLQG